MPPRNGPRPKSRPTRTSKLRRIIRHAYENVPYYRERWKSLKLVPADIQCREDLAKLPILTKEEFGRTSTGWFPQKASKHDLALSPYEWDHRQGAAFLCYEAAIAFQWAVWWRHRCALESSLETPCQLYREESRAARSTHSSVLALEQAPASGADDYAYLAPGKIASMVEFLNSHPFDFYSGYPSFIHMLALHAGVAGLR